LGPTLLIGMGSALQRGMSHFVSFSALFSITQSLGGLAGSALLGTFQTWREKIHSHALVQGISLSDPLDAARIQLLGNGYSRVVTDPLLRQTEGAMALAQQVTREANVLAFNDVFLVIGILSTVTFVWLLALYLNRVVPGNIPDRKPPPPSPSTEKGT